MIPSAALGAGWRGVTAGVESACPMSRVETWRASRLRVGVSVVATAVLALAVVGPAPGTSERLSKYGGTLVVSFPGEPASLDPTLVLPFSAVNVYRTICEKLYDLDSNAKVVSQLAAALPTISKDKLTYT